MLVNQINALKEKITSGNFMVSQDFQLWGGSDVVITDKMTTDFKDWQNDSHIVVGSGNIQMSNRKVVCTKYAKELSKIFDELKIIFYDFIDFSNKYDFYSSLAEAAMKALQNGDGINVLIDTIKQAETIAKDIDSKFTYNFAFGSNMDEGQLLSRCSQASLLGKAVLNDYKFIINERGVASIIEETGSYVEGVIWLLTKSDEVNLDRHEGIGKGYYYKKNIIVITELEPKREIETRVYLATNQTIGKPREGYLEKILNAAAKFKFNLDYVEKIKGFK